MLVYLVTDPTLDEFRVLLERTLQIVVPPHFLRIAQRAKQVVWNQLLTLSFARIKSGSRPLIRRAQNGKINAC